MAVTIKLKNASGSDPSASDLVVGEVAIRTDNGKLFTKKDNGSVAEITGGGGIDDGDKGDITVSNSGATFTIDNDVVTYAKIQNVSATDRILGRDSSGAGDIEEIAPSAVRTMLGLASSATTDTTNASNISSGTLAAARVATLNQDTTGNAATATALETARTIAGVSFDGTSNISLNNNAITNGAGYITATLTNEQVQDIVGGMVTGNTETGITVTYQDGDGTLDFVVGTLNQDTTGNAATATALETARTIGGVSFDGTSNINLAGVNTSGNQDTSGNAATATKLATARTIAGVSFDGSANISLNNNAITNGAGYVTSSGSITGNAGTATALATSRTIAGTSFNGTANIDISFDNLTNKPTIPTNNNQLTNGAGYITSATDNTKMPLSGGEFTGDVTCHNLIPDGNDTRDLGSSTARWRDIYTGDLHLSNKNKVNKVDGTWGDWTLQEGEDAIFMLNNRNGKKYKMNLTEIV